MDWQRAALCVITVDDGPGGRRWALVSTSITANGQEVERSRHVEPDQILRRVRRFLAEAGLPEAGLREADPTGAAVDAAAEEAAEPADGAGGEPS